MSRAVIDTSPADPVAGPIVAAVAFDFNGTLADDEPILESIFRELLAARGITLTRDDYFRKLAGLSDPEIAARGLAMAGVAPDPEAVAELVAEKAGRYRQRVAACSPLRPGAVALVRALAGRLPLAVVSGADRAEVEAVLGPAGILQHLTVMVCAQDVRAGKPDPEGYLLALRAFAPIPAAQVVAIEDSRPGIAAARAAGMRCLAVRGTVPDEALASDADGVFDGLGPELARELLDG